MNFARLGGSHQALPHDNPPCPPVAHAASPCFDPRLAAGFSPVCLGQIDCYIIYSQLRNVYGGYRPK